MTNTGLMAKRGLEDDDLAQLHILEAACRHADGVALKLNWSMRRGQSSEHLTDFCCYRDGQLVGFMPLDGFGSKFEITGTVLPAYRRQGIFRLLFEAARQEAQKCQATQLLLVNYRASEAGTAVTKRLGVAYQISEYCMEADAINIPPLPPGEIRLEEVTSANVHELARLLAISFGDGQWRGPEELLADIRRGDRHYYLAQVGETIIGQIGVVAQENVVYIRAVGIVPEWRRRGYGRQLLAATVHKMLAEGHRHFELDVETENSQALPLYQVCGFRETNAYDYYSVPL